MTPTATSLRPSWPSIASGDPGASRAERPEAMNHPTSERGTAVLESTTQSVRGAIDYVQTMVELQLGLMGVDTRDDEGALTIEMAALVSILVIIAGIVGAILLQKATSNASSIPDRVDPRQAP